MLSSVFYIIARHYPYIQLTPPNPYYTTNRRNWKTKTKHKHNH